MSDHRPLEVLEVIGLDNSLTLQRAAGNLLVMDVETQAEPIVRLTENAAAEVKSMVAKPENEGKSLRVYVEDGGCSGLQYGMTFDQPREKDQIHEFFGVAVLVDPFSANYLQGTVVDFSDDINSHGFKITNPKARQTCGCGRSFEA